MFTLSDKQPNLRNKHLKSENCQQINMVGQFMLGTHPAPSFSRTSLNKTTELTGMVSYTVSTAVKAMVSEIHTEKKIIQEVDLLKI